MRMRALLAAALLASTVSPTDARAERAAALSPSLPQSLMVFDTASPAVVTVRSILGVGAGESIPGLDGRPATGQLYAVTATTGSAANSVVRTYTVDAETGVIAARPCLAADRTASV
jgi:hypothetical protein